MEELKQSLASIQSKIESLFSSISQELKSAEAFLEKQSKGLTQPLELVENELKLIQTQTKSDSDAKIAELKKLLA